MTSCPTRARRHSPPDWELIHDAPYEHTAGDGWGVHADGNGRLAVYPVGTPEYEALAAGTAPGGTPVTVLSAMRSARR